MALHEPYKIKSIRNIRFRSFPDRKKALRNASYNVGLIPSCQVAFDMVTQGSSAMSQEQVGNLFIGDEAYAGARNFYKLCDAVRDVFALDNLCPVHNTMGGLKLLSYVHLAQRKIVAGNTEMSFPTFRAFGGECVLLDIHPDPLYTGNIDLKNLARFLEQNKGKVAMIYIDLQGGGYRPVSPSNLEGIKKLADEHQVKLVMDASCIVEAAYHSIQHDPAFKDKELGSMIRLLAGLCHTLLFDGGQDAMSNVGGFLATGDPNDHEHYRNVVVIFEGLHTYGGMAGRTMEVVATGLREMTDPLHAQWVDHQVSVLAGVLERGNVPFTRGYNGVYLHAGRFLSDAEPVAAQTLAAALYLISGVRCHLDDVSKMAGLLPVLLPRRTFMNTQVEQIGEAIVKLFDQRSLISSLDLINQPVFTYEERFEWIIPELESYRFTCEPYTIHSIEHVGMDTREQRVNAMKESGYNTFLLKSEDVTIDLLTDSGTSAMSVEQWLAYLRARETPATPDAYHEVVATAQKIYGYKHIILTHQGRAAEHIMSQMFIRKGDYVPGNMYFTTTREHQEMAGGTFVDVIVDEAHQTTCTFPWKGNVDLSKMEALYEKAKLEGKKLSYLSFEFNVNLAGGLPVSMNNIKAVYAWCKTRDIPVFFDATRCSENACFIQRNDPVYRNVPVADILLEMFSYGDGATISSKKDMLSNLSGCLLFRDNEQWCRKALQLLNIFEGPYCSGGTSAGDMAAHAQGLREMVDDAYINSRIEQTAYLGELLHKAGIPIVLPYGGHAIFLDARAFLPHLDQDQFPAQMLAAQIFIETGVRAMERGNVSKGRNHATGKNFRPALELVRLTIPRRVYTRDHMKAVADGIIRLYEKRNSIGGLRFTYEPDHLRFFQGRFEEI
ncbi:MAG TPA: tryptophanase [Bacteroidales bacterium]|nr:tryptophanase [Bacteroidales bacterium]